MGTQEAMGYRGIAHMGNKAHRGYVVQGVWGTGAIGHNGYRGYGYRGYWQGMGHMGNGPHGPWGTWAMGPMGDLNIFAYNFINTGWILTKILLDIDINVFYRNTPRFLHDGFI